VTTYSLEKTKPIKICERKMINLISKGKKCDSVLGSFLFVFYSRANNVFLIDDFPELDFFDWSG